MLCILNHVFFPKHICMFFAWILESNLNISVLPSCALYSSSRIFVLVHMLCTNKENVNLNAESEAVEKLLKSV